jgi:hypothetical protein
VQGLLISHEVHPLRLLLGWCSQVQLPEWALSWVFTSGEAISTQSDFLTAGLTLMLL